MSEWQVVYSAEAEQDLLNIYNYIAHSLLAAENASAQAERIMNAVDALANMPMRHPVYPQEPWKSVGLRFMPVDHYLVFYMVDEQQRVVSIVRIAYGARSMLQLLSDT